MERLSLRDYHREIETLIENSSFDTAIAHCRHILKTFPKNIDTYRLLGKAYLESQRYVEAVDIFQRVLSVYPDDFLAHLGLSIIKEEQGNLDAAIWHLERAYEVQPSNPALQSELKRLYGRRDGMEPPKIRLTRAALARMYQRGELYPQALAEVQTALVEDPSRIDLEILQAQLLTQLGKHSEAFQIANKLVTKLPFSYQANKIISQAETYADDPEKVEKARDILSAIDPYVSQSTSQPELADGLSDDMIMVEKAAVAVISQPTASQDSVTSTDTSYTAETDIVQSDQNRLAVDSDPITVTDQSQLPIIEHLEDAPEAASQTEVTDTEEIVTDEQRKKVISKMMVDLTDLDGDLDPSLEDTLKITLKPEPEAPAESVETPEVETAEGQSENHLDPDLPSWLSGLKSEPDQSSSFVKNSTIPEWLFTMDDSLTESDRVAASTPVEDIKPELADTTEIDQAIAWLEGLAEKHGVPETSLLLPVENRIQQAPAWISRLKNILNEEEKQQVETAKETDLVEITEEVLPSSTESIDAEGLGEITAQPEEIITENGMLEQSDEGQNILNVTLPPSDITDTAMIKEDIETASSMPSPVDEGITNEELFPSNSITQQAASEISNNSGTASTEVIVDENLNIDIKTEAADKLQDDLVDKPEALIEQQTQSTVENQNSDTEKSIDATLMDLPSAEISDTEPVTIDQSDIDKKPHALDQSIENLNSEQIELPSLPDSSPVVLPDVDVESPQVEISELSTAIQSEVVTESQDKEISNNKAPDNNQENDAKEITSVTLDGIDAHDTVSSAAEVSTLEELSAENPEDVEALRQLAKDYTRLGKFDEAKSIYKKIVKILRQ